jgi:hypothetical protein
VSEPLAFRIDDPKVVHEVFDDEVVIINLETGVYYSVACLAADVWTSIGESEDLIRDLAARYRRPAADVEAVIRPFLDRLVDEGLIVPDLRADGDPPPRAGAGRAATPAPAFETPVLHKYSDMQELLLLDPIHEVDDVGWPVRPNELGSGRRKDPA